MHRAMPLAAVLAILGLWPSAALAAPGDLDTGFNGSGTVVTDLGDAPGFADVGLSVAVDSAGRTVVAGAATPDAQDSDFALARYAADGTLDPTFGNGGRVVTDVSEGNASAKAILIDAAGRILVAGVSNDEVGSSAFTLARYESDGSLDTTFGGGDGITTTTADLYVSFGGIEDIALDATGRILAVGSGGTVPEGEAPFDLDLVLLRFTESGILDTTFGGGEGTITTDLSGSNDEAKAIAIIGGGQIVVGGTKGTCCAGSPEIAIVRYESSGALDSGFGGGDGIVTTAIENGAVVVDLALTGGGKIAVAAQGSSLFPGSMDNITVAQYTSAGSLDTAFGGGDGIVTTTVGSTTTAGGLAVDSSDRVVVAGTTRTTEGVADFAVLRYTANGDLDSAFGGGDGIAITDAGSIGDVAQGVVIDGSGRIVVAGNTGNCCGDADDFATVRYTSVGSVDGAFGDGDGIVHTDFPTDSGDFGNDIVLDDQGRAVVVGMSSVGDGQPKFLVARYDTDGQLDPSFGSDGIVLTDIPDGDTERANAVTIDSLGRIVVAGSSFTTTYYDFTLARYDATGALDPTFGGDGVVTTTFQPFLTDDAAADIAIDSQDRIVAGGNSEGSFALARYNPDGSLDSAFGGGDGKTTGEVTGNASAMVLESDDDIVLAGSDGNDQVVARFDASGSLDTSFGSSGVVTTGLGGNDSGDDVALDSSGRIIVSGRSEADFGLVRYLPDGSLDTSFGGDGIVTTEIVPGGFAEARALAIDGQGRILAAGDVLPDPAEFGLDVVVARYNPSGSLDPGFGGGDGIVLTDVGSEDSVEAVALTAGDDLVVAGSTVPDFGSDLLLVRYVGGGPLTTLTWTLDVTKTGEGSGVITGPDIDCGPDCSETYDEGASVTLTATANDGSLFAGWSGDCAGTGTCQVTMDAAKEVTATFDPVIDEPPPSEPPPEEPPASSPASTPLPGGSNQPAASDNDQIGLAVAAGVAPIKSGKALLRLRCRSQAACQGVAKLIARNQAKRSARRSAATRTRNMVIGQSRFRVPASKAKVLRIRLTRRGQQLLRGAGHQGLQARLAGSGLKARTVRLKPTQGKRRQSRSKRLLTASMARRAKGSKRKRVVHPVKLTIKIKSAVLPPDSVWRDIEGVAGAPVIALYGRVTSPKPACKRKRPIISVTEYPPRFVPEVDKRTGITSDATGRWEGEPFPDLFGLGNSSYREAIRRGDTRQRVKVARKRLGNGRFCAEAISAYLKA